MKSTRTQPLKNQAGSIQLSRRQFIRIGAATTAIMSFPYVGRVLGANDKISVGCIGVAGKGDSDTDDTANCGANIAALCDVDSNHLKNKAKKFPDAKQFRDFREMIDQMGNQIDAVTVSIPDHCHGVASALAMEKGKHVYCQKPLTQTIFETHILRDLAAKKKVATQMGNQGSASSKLRRAVELIQAGLIGNVTELHVWTNRPIWPQGFARPEGTDPVPASLNWDSWIGPAQMRPYKKGIYDDFVWRGWHDFGTGALGDMACHMVNMPFRALKLGYPTVVECEETSQQFPETYPKRSRIRFEFPEREGLPPLKFWWYDGNPEDPNMPPLRPRPELTKDVQEVFDKIPEGVLLIGDEGKFFSPDSDTSKSIVMLKNESSYTATDQHSFAKTVPESIPRSPGHNEEWFRMMRDGTPAYSNFAIASKLTEIILLGCVALRVGTGKAMQWDGKHTKSPNCPEAAQFVKRHNRDGWKA